MQLELEGVQWSGDVKYHLGASRAISGGEEREPRGLDAAESESSRGDQSGARRHGARGRHDASKPGRADVQPRRGPADPHPRRRGLPGTGRRGRDAESAPARRATRPAARFTSSPTTRSASRPSRAIRTARCTRAAWRAASRSRSSTSTPTIRKRASRWRGWRSATAMKFRRDVLIDLVGYRRYGHNEGDEPAFTQPVMYQQISRQRPVRQVWATMLESRGVIEAGLADAMLDERLTKLQRTLDDLDPAQHLAESPPTPAPRGRAAAVVTAVAPDLLRDINESLLVTPETFHVHRKLERGRERRWRASTIRRRRPSTGRWPRNWHSRRFSTTARRFG